MSSVDPEGHELEPIGIEDRQEVLALEDGNEAGPKYLSLQLAVVVFHAGGGGWK